MAGAQFYNTNILLERNFNHTLWVGKISRSLPKILPNYFGSGKDYIRTVNFCDIDDRAILGFRLAKLLGLKTIRAKIIPDSLIKSFDFNLIVHPRVNNNIFLTEYRGISLPEYLATHSFNSIQTSDIKNKEEIIKSFVFNLWIGCYDSKDTDYLVDNEKNLISIDYHLSGPGFLASPKLSVGAWGEAFDLDNIEDTGWCGGGDKVLEYIRQTNSPLESYQVIINKILSLPKTQIKFVMRGLNFYNQGTSQKINNIYFNFLLERRPKLELAVRQWINARYPLAKLPKNNGIA